jgi:hypothetical protein
MNLQQIKGQTEEGDIIDAESMSKSEKALANVGIGIREMRNGIEELRDPMVILEELAKKWENLSSVEQSQLVEGIGGKYRGNQLVALLEGWDIYEKTVDEFLNNNNSAIKENEIYMDSWGAKSKQLSASVTKMWMTTLNTDAIKGFIDGVRSVVDILTKMGGLIPIISSLLGYLLVGSIVKNIAVLGGMAKTLGIAITAIKAFNINLAYTMLLSGGWIPILAAVVVGIGAYYAVTKNAKKGTDEFTDAITLQTKKYKELKEQQDQINKTSNEYRVAEEGKILLAERLIDKVYEMSKAYNGSEVEMARMKQALDKINQIMPSVNLAIDTQTGKLNKEKAAVEGLITQYKNLIMVKAAEKAAEGQADIAFQAKVNIENEKKVIDRVNSELRAMGISETQEKGMTEFSQMTRQNPFIVGTMNNPNPQSIEKLIRQKENAIKTLKEEEKILSSADNQIKSYMDLAGQYALDIPQIEEGTTTGTTITTDLDKSDKSNEPSFNSIIPARIREITLQTDQDKIQQDILANEISKLEKAEEYQQKLELQNKLLNLQKDSITNIKSAQNQLKSEADKVRATTKYDTESWFLPDGETTVAYDELFNSVGKALGKEAQDDLEKIKDALQSLKKEWRSLQGVVDDYSDAVLESQKNIEKLNEEMVKAYIKSHNEKVEAVEKTELKIQEIIKKGIDLRKEKLDDELDDYEEFIDAKIAKREEEWEAEDLAKQKDKEVKTITEIQKKISALSRTNTLSGIAKRKELEEELAEELEKIQDADTKRRRENEKKAMEDSLKFKQNSVKTTKELIDKEWSNERITLEARDALFNQSFERLRKEFPELFGQLQVSTDNFFGVFDSYETTFGSNITSMRNNIAELVADAQKAATAIQSLFNENQVINQARQSGDISGLSTNQLAIEQDRDKSKIRDLQLEWHRLNNLPNKDSSTISKMKSLSEEASKLRSKYGWVNTSENPMDLRNYETQFPDMSNSFSANTKPLSSVLPQSPISKIASIVSPVSSYIKGLKLPMPVTSPMGAIGNTLSIVINGNTDNATVNKIKDVSNEFLAKLTNSFKKNGN